MATAYGGRKQCAGLCAVSKVSIVGIAGREGDGVEPDYSKSISSSSLIVPVTARI